MDGRTEPSTLIHQSRINYNQSCEKAKIFYFIHLDLLSLQGLGAHLKGVVWELFSGECLDFILA
jgi:hypothetical protein